MILQEYVNPAQSKFVMESDSNGKNLYMKGICIQGDIKNANERVYPVNEISTAVKTLNEQIQQGYSVLGEADHPDDLKINIDRVSHMITEMYMDGSNGIGKLKIIETPMGKIIKTMLESNVKLGVSSRGSGNVNESNGAVSEFEIVTIDIVSQPSGPNCYPKPIYEGAMNMRDSKFLMEALKDSNQTRSVQKYVQKEIMNLIKELKL